MKAAVASLVLVLAVTYLGLKDYLWPGGLASFTRIGGRARAQSGGVGFANGYPSASKGDLTTQEQLLRE